MFEMKTTFKRIKEFNPCKEGWQKLIGYYKPEAFEEFVSIEEIIKSNGIKDALWALRCLEGEENRCKIALLCADIVQSVLHFFEKEYPHDERPKQAIEAIRKYVKKKLTIQEFQIIKKHNAAYAAYAYAAAYAAADATYADATADATAKKWEFITNLLISYINK